LGESQVFRIDHFLGKESVDDILACRSANRLLGPVWNRKHISYVQIDAPETLSIEGRADFYDHIGACRDMIVTHLFQILGFVPMELPTSLDARAPAKDRQGLRRAQADRSRPRGTRPVRRLPQRARRPARLRHRNPGRSPSRDRQLAVGRWSRSSCAPAKALPRAIRW